jgi:hypothetical protein
VANDSWEKDCAEAKARHARLALELAEIDQLIIENESICKDAPTADQRQRAEGRLGILKLDREKVEKEMAHVPHWVLRDVPPDNYEKDGQEYCGLHNVPLSGTYRVIRNSIFADSLWRFADDSKFPNPKLHEAGPDDESDRTDQFCPECQRALDEWLSDFKRQNEG